jgi:NADH:ubiquinone oxidoreductase subunit 2 (subunit N)
VTERTHKILLSVIVAATLAVVFVTERIMGVDPSPPRNMLASFINMVMLVATVAVLRLVRGAPGDSAAKPQSTDILLVMTLITAGVLVGVWSGGRLFANLSMLVLMAYSVGRWRGLKQSRVSPSNSLT